MKTRMMVLTSILLIASISCQMLTDFLPSGGSNPDSFTAAATSPISVQLTWSRVEGAQKYLIERNDAQTDYFPLGEISGETTTFEDFLVPSNTQVSYRIKTVTASGTSGGKTVSLTTPQEFPNPLTVTATFDTQNAQSQAIGADGGSVSITDSRGVSYTLDIPAGSLENEVTFTLTPIQDIQGLPLSGGMTSGVRIEPEGMRLDPPATLSIVSTQPEPSDGLVGIGFAFDGAGSEFHFEPGYTDERTSGAPKLASLLPSVNAAKGKMWIVHETRSQGTGRGTSKEIRNQTKNHPPSKPADNLNQKIAAGDADLLAPLIDKIGTRGREVELQVAAIDDWSSLNSAIWTFGAWWESAEQKRQQSGNADDWKKREDAIWEELTTNAKLMLEKAAADCEKSPNLADAKRLVNNLTKGDSPFYRKFAEKFGQQYGVGTLEAIKARLDKCTAGYRVQQTGPNYWVSWSGVICSLEQPFTLTGVAPYASGTIPFPTLFTPTSPTAGFATQDVTVSFTGCTTHFVENGPYRVDEKSPGQFEIVWQATTNYIEHTCGIEGQPSPEEVRFPLQPLDANACSQP